MDDSCCWGLGFANAGAPWFYTFWLVSIRADAVFDVSVARDICMILDVLVYTHMICLFRCFKWYRIILFLFLPHFSQFCFGTLEKYRWNPNSQDNWYQLMSPIWVPVPQIKWISTTITRIITMFECLKRALASSFTAIRVHPSHLSQIGVNIIGSNKSITNLPVGIWNPGGSENPMVTFGMKSQGKTNRGPNWRERDYSEVRYKNTTRNSQLMKWVLYVKRFWYIYIYMRQINQKS